MKNYILLQDRLSTGGAFILCDANTNGFPIRYASPGFADLFEYTPAECMGKSCGNLVGGPSILANDPDCEDFEKTCGLDCKKIHECIATLTQHATSAVQEMFAKPGELFTFALVVNRKKSGEMIVNEVIMFTQQHPSFGWKYCVGLQNDVTHDISVATLLNSAEGYEQLHAAREESVKERISLLQLESDTVSEYLREKTSEMWTIFMTEMLADTKLKELSAENLVSTEADDYTNINSSVGTWSPLVGAWRGVVHQTLGGYEQVMEFSIEDSTVRVEVMGRSIYGEFFFDQEFEPHHLDMQFFVANSKTKQPQINYIAKIEGGMLHLCCPVQTTTRPREFKGPGYCLMKRVEQDQEQ